MTSLVDHGTSTAQLDRPDASPHAEAHVVAKAAVRAATILDISPVALGKILGLSKSGQARLAAGAFELAPTGGPFVRATLFVRTFALLDTMTGGDEEAARSWLCAHNNVLRDTPLKAGASAKEAAG